jgi:hypothetical protein
MEFYSAIKNMKFCHVQVNEWKWRISEVKLIRLRRLKTACSPLYVHYKPKTNVTILDTGHIKGRSCTGVIGQGKETKILKVLDVFSVQEWT